MRPSKATALLCVLLFSSRGATGRKFAFIESSAANRTCKTKHALVAPAPSVVFMKVPRQPGNYLDSPGDDVNSTNAAADGGGGRHGMLSAASMSKMKLPNMSIPDIKGNLPNVTLPKVPKVSLPDVELPKVPKPPWRSNKNSRNADVIIDVDVRSSDIPSMMFLGALPELELPWSGTRKMKSTEESIMNSTAIFDALKANINKVTGKDTYEFGDLTRYVGSQAKTVVSGLLTGDAQDLSRQVNKGIKDRIDMATYSVADISRTLIKKVASGEYDLSDITFLCKILVALGADFSPVAGLLPIRLLLELFGYSIAIDLGERFVTTIVKELDKRLLINDEELLPESEGSGETSQGYVAGDLTKQAIQKYVGKDTYEAGDIAGLNLLNESFNNDDAGGIDVLKELEEFLAMERELVEKLNKVAGSKERGDSN